jgi:multidrug efflux pump subunit AcrA (membrane-fusion protein)
MSKPIMSARKKRMVLAGGILCLAGSMATVQVGSQVSGNILALLADFNTKVAKGQLIARIDPAPFQTKVNQAKASLDAARAAVAAAGTRRNCRRPRT